MGKNLNGFNAERSTTYRQEFFKHNKGFLKGKLYHCSYCGKLCKAKNITVDHLIPIRKAQKKKFWRFWLKRKGITDVNDVRNLVPACKRCNSRKGSKTNLGWLLLGTLGKHYIFFAIRNAAFLALVGCFAVQYIQGGR